jgi:outer membrane protein TolC
MRHNINTIFTTCLFVANIFCLSTFAQEVSDYSKLSMQDFQNMQLPPLSVLFENAKNSPSYQFEDVNVQVQNNLLAMQRRNFLSFFSIRGSYQYGRLANDFYYSDVYTPATTKFTSQNQNLYSVGAGLSIPLDKLFDLAPSVKRQKLAIRSAELQRDVKLEEVKKQIIESYTYALQQMSTLRTLNETLLQATQLYDLAEKEFANGKITPGDLSTFKTREGVEKRAYETCKFELIKSLMTLELISHTTIFKH